MLDARLLEYLLDGIQECVVASVDDLLDARVDDELRAGEARRERHVDGASGNCDSVMGRLADRVLLGVRAKTLVQPHSALDIACAARASAFKAVLHSARRSVVAGGEDVVVLHDDGPHVAARAVRALRHHMGYLHEVFVPAWTRIFRLAFHQRQSV